MTEIKDLRTTYNTCQADGTIKIKKEVDKDLIASLLQSAQDGLKRSGKKGEEFEKETDNYSFIFVERYEILRKLIDAFLLFDKIQISNHQCSNAYLCIKHPELEIDWKTIETMRLTRNKVNYKGKIVNHEVWKSYKLKFEIYINTFSKEVEKKLSKI